MNFFKVSIIVATALVAGAVQAQEAASVPVEAKPVPTTHWEVETTPSALDASRSRGVASLESTNRIRDAIGNPRPATIIVRCIGRDRVAYFDWPKFLGTRAVTATWKYDEGRVQTGYLSTSSDGTAAGTWSARESAALISALRSSHRLVIALEAYNGIAEEAIFDLDGGDAAIAEALAACG